MQKDIPGPVHALSIIKLKIAGAQLETYPSVDYKYGQLTEFNNQEWLGMQQSAPIVHGYFVSSDGKEPRDEWYVHELTLDRYVLVSGRLEIALFDAREGSPTKGTLEIFQLGGLASSLPSGMMIPPGVWHSFNSVDGEFMFLNHKYPGYNQSNPDKYRIPMPNEHCSHVWGQS